MTEMKVTFLGTSSMVPTKERGHSGIYVDCGKEKILVDCGENIQRQMRIAGISPPKTTRIFLSHWHGDHVFGLPGLIENLANGMADKKISVYGTKEVKVKLDQMMKVFGQDKKIKVDFTIVSKNGVFLDTEDFEFGACFLNHSAPCLGYYFKEKDKIIVDKKKMKKLGLPSGPLIADLKLKKDITYKDKKIKWKDVTSIRLGKKLGIVVDTGLCAGAVNVGKDADLFIIESTFLHDKEVVAKKYKHLTSVQAGDVAKKAGCKKLAITHFSQRYESEDVDKMRKEAKKAFGKEVICAKDFMKVSV